MRTDERNRQPVAIAKKSPILIAIAGLLLSGVPAAQADPYETVAKKILLAAKKNGYRRVAVLPLRAISSSDRRSGVVLSERLTSRLAGREGLQVVERQLLDSVLREQRLGHEGFIDAAQAQKVGRILGVEALMTGTFLPLTDNRIEIHTRLIDAETARILGVSIAKVAKEWEDDTFLVPPPFHPVTDDASDDFQPPSVRLIPNPFRDALNGGSRCEGWERSVERMQAESIESKAKYWATRLREPGFSPKTLTRNPGSEIQSMELRQIFFARLKELYSRGFADGITPEQKARMEMLAGRVEKLREKCY